jgi:hypothetical protein
MKCPYNDDLLVRDELTWLKIDCAAIVAVLQANSVSPTTAPTAVNFAFADRSQWLKYHGALLSQLTGASLTYSRT